MAKLSHLSQVFQLSGQTVMQRVCVISSLLIFLTCFTWTITPLLAQEVQEAQEASDADPVVAPVSAPAPTVAAQSLSRPLPHLVDIAKKAKKSVVNISTTQKAQRRQSQQRPGPFGGEDRFEEFFRRFFPNPSPNQPRSLGSGFIISDDGYIVTNNHVIGEAEKITVRLSDEEEYEAKVIGSDERTDLALIKIDSSTPLSSVPLGNSEALLVGDWVMAIGNPFGLEQTVTVGIVSAKGRVIGAGPYDDFIQTDASINPGNSGGPLLNLKGEVIGINSAIFSRGGGNIGIGFAIPIDQAKSIISQLKESGKVTRGWLGVMIQPVTKELADSFGLTEPKGALVAEVTEDGPAKKAGLERGDVITTFNGVTINDSRDLPAVVAQSPVGSDAAVKILRGGKEENISVTLGELPSQLASAAPAEASQESWGMTVANITPEIAGQFRLESDKTGVIVTQVEPGSPAAAAGIRPGDLIEEVNRKAVTSVDDFTTAVAELKEEETLLILARRGTFTSFFALKKSG
jgi:serine protease Do